MGAYLEITLVTGPSEASYGSSVTLTAYVKNVWTQDILYADATARIDNIEVVPPYGRINVHDTRFFPITFTMPNKSVIVTVFAMYWGTDNQWHEDDRKQFSIKLAGETPPPGISASIESLKVYAEGTAPVYPPLLNVIPGKKVSIKFDAHSNYGSLPFGLWFDAYAILKKPVSGSESRYDKSETGPYSMCTLDHFDFKEDWVADEKGTYYADIILKARSSLYGSSVEVDKKTNVKVFTVTQDVPSPDEYSGEISKVQGRTGVANWGGIPLSLKQGDGYSIAVTVTNKSSIALVLRGTLTITKPSGNKDTASDFTGTSVPYIETTVSPGASHTFKWNPYPQVHAFTADEVGDYQASFALQGKKSGEPDSAYRALCDPWQGTVATVSSPHGEPSGKAEIVRKALDFELLGSGYEIPVTKTLSVPEHARLSIIAKTISTERERLKAEVWIYGPAPVLGQQEGGEITHGPLKYHYTDTSSWPCCDPETQHEFIWPSSLVPLPNSTFLIDEEGQWTITINITDASDGELLATYDGVMCGAEKAAPSIWGIFAEIMPLMMIMMMFGMMIPMMRDVAGELEEGHE
jgi:hypothetical protein